MTAPTFKDYAIEIPQENPACATPPDQISGTGIGVAVGGALLIYGDGGEVLRIYAPGRWLMVSLVEC